MNPGYLELLRAAAPETVVVFTALVALTVDLLAAGKPQLGLRFRVSGLIAMAGCAAAIAWMLAVPTHADYGNGMMAGDSVTRTVKIAILGLSFFTVALSLDAPFTRHPGEYIALILIATAGMMLLAGAGDLLMIFLSLELTSLSLYILAGFDKEDIQSAETALNYFLFGTISAAFTLFGLSLLYGMTGATQLPQLAAALQPARLDPLLLTAMAMTLVGFGFKVAAAPFHLWAPDTYQGAPLPSAALIASGSKVAGFFVLAKVTMLGLAGAEGSGAWGSCQPGWVAILGAMAAVSMLLGNLAAIAQTSIRRLLAYSAIAHAGYALLAIMAHGPKSLPSLVYYVITYSIAVVGAFGVVAVVKQQSGGDRLADFAGLSRHSPLLAFCLLVFLLSLAGIPPLAGFFGKFYVFSVALQDGNPVPGLLWLVILALAMSAVSLYYYLQVLKQAYVAEPSSVREYAVSSSLQQVALALLAVAVIILGCWPELLLSAFVAGL